MAFVANELGKASLLYTFVFILTCNNWILSSVWIVYSCRLVWLAVTLYSWDCKIQWMTSKLLDAKQPVGVRSNSKSFSSQHIFGPSNCKHEAWRNVISGKFSKQFFDHRIPQPTLPCCYETNQVVLLRVRSKDVDRPGISFFAPGGQVCSYPSLHTILFTLKEKRDRQILKMCAMRYQSVILSCCFIRTRIWNLEKRQPWRSHQSWRYPAAWNPEVSWCVGHKTRLKEWLWLCVATEPLLRCSRMDEWYLAVQVGWST